MTLGWIFAEPEAATFSVFPEMLQLVPEVPVCPVLEIVRFCPNTPEVIITRVIKVEKINFSINVRFKNTNCSYC
jgi:hypothetical protein